MSSQKSKWYKGAKIWAISIFAVFLVPKLIDYLYLVGSGKINTTITTWCYNNSKT